MELGPVVDLRLTVAEALSLMELSRHGAEEMSADLLELAVKAGENLFDQVAAMSDDVRKAPIGPFDVVAG